MEDSEEKHGESFGRLPATGPQTYKSEEIAAVESRCERLEGEMKRMKLQLVRSWDVRQVRFV